MILNLYSSFHNITVFYLVNIRDYNISLSQNFWIIVYKNDSVRTLRHSNWSVSKQGLICFLFSLFIFTSQYFKTDQNLLTQVICKLSPYGQNVMFWGLAQLTDISRIQNGNEGFHVYYSTRGVNINLKRAIWHTHANICTAQSQEKTKACHFDTKVKLFKKTCMSLNSLGWPALSGRGYYGCIDAEGKN